MLPSLALILLTLQHQGLDRFQQSPLLLLQLKLHTLLALHQRLQALCHLSLHLHLACPCASWHSLLLRARVQQARFRARSGTVLILMTRDVAVNISALDVAVTTKVLDSLS
jgi:hypothetical protein